MVELKSQALGNVLTPGKVVGGHMPVAGHETVTASGAGHHQLPSPSSVVSFLMQPGQKLCPQRSSLGHTITVRQMGHSSMASNSSRSAAAGLEASVVVGWAMSGRVMWVVGVHGPRFDGWREGQSAGRARAGFRNRPCIDLWVERGEAVQWGKTVKVKGTNQCQFSEGKRTVAGWRK